jgi:hypothetical protein
MEVSPPFAQPLGRHGNHFCYVYVLAFCTTWLHTWLVKGRGYSESQLRLSSLPFFVAAAANFIGGLASRSLAGELGLRQARCAIGFTGLAFSATVAVAVILVPNSSLALPLLSLLIAGVTFQQPTMFAACLDIGEESAGAVDPASQDQTGWRMSRQTCAERTGRQWGSRFPGTWFWAISPRPDHPNSKSR